MIDIINLFNQHSIEYVTSGPNVAKGNINIQCPFCGGTDPSHHLGINLTDGRWGCWRDSTHRGRSLFWLLRELIGITYEEVQLLGTPDLGNIEQQLHDIFNPEKAALKPEVTEATVPSEFKALTPTGYGKKFLDYLRIYRGFTNETQLAQEYKLMYALTGRFSWRLIIPAIQNNKVVAWTGRSINGSLTRYKSNAQEEGLPINNCLLNYDNLAMVGTEILAITEGPIDSMKLDFYGREVGVRSTCLFGLHLTDSQTYYLLHLKKHFRQLVLILDSEAWIQSMEIQRMLHTIGVKSFFLPGTIKDLGELDPKSCVNLAKYLVGNLP